MDKKTFHKPLGTRDYLLICKNFYGGLFFRHMNIYLHSHNGGLAQLVQSICLTSRGSGVRTPQPPHKPLVMSGFFIISKFIFCILPLLINFMSDQQVMKQKIIFISIIPVIKDLPAEYNPADLQSSKNLICSFCFVACCLQICKF